MIKTKMKNEKGISLVSLSIAVAVLVILSNIIIYNVSSNLKIGKLKEIQNDVENLRAKVSNYYAQNGQIPAKLQYNNIEHLRTAGMISQAVDTGNFLVIDLSALENLTLNRGADYEKIKQLDTLTEEQAKQYTDLYIINEVSHNIFYVEGVTVDNETFYTDYTAKEKDTAPVNLVDVDLTSERWSPQYDKEGIYKDKNGDTAYIPEGFCVSEKEGETTIDGGLVVKDSNQNEWVWIEVPKSIYNATTTNTNYTAIEKAMQNYASAYRDSGYSDTFYSTEQHGFANETEYNNHKNSMLKSVFENGGFYIGRYETGTETPRFSSSANLTTPIIQRDAYPYNFVSCSQAQTKATELATGGKTTSLMFGIQWDLILKFIEEKGGKTQEELKIDSGNWGNYNDVTFEIAIGYYTTAPATSGSWKRVSGTSKYTKPTSAGVLLTTGATDRNSTLGIYDLAGNVWEWTLAYSMNSNEPCTYYGGSHGDQGNHYTAFYRFYSDTSYSSNGFGFRSALW
ncbi:MAG: formylglycine-generating enzyme family protein [Clostridia bacterium]|nr:formylglycine-generating enzyme family protein [Clostridia bacterium]